MNRRMHGGRGDLFAPLVMSSTLRARLSELFPGIMPSVPSGSVLCGDGWYGVLESGLSRIQEFCDLCSEGRDPVRVGFEKIEEHEGALRFFCRIECDDELERGMIVDMIRMMEISSLYFCEITGNSPASLCRRGPRLRTLCRDAADREGFEPCSPLIAASWCELDAGFPPPRTGPAASTAPDGQRQTARHQPGRHADRDDSGCSRGGQSRRRGFVRRPGGIRRRHPAPDHHPENSKNSPPAGNPGFRNGSSAPQPIAASLMPASGLAAAG